jgi:hypothetical protein
MLFRDWEDSLKENYPTIYNEGRTNTMSLKDWKNKELSKNLTNKWGFNMDLTKLNEAHCGTREGEEEIMEEKCPKCEKEPCECPKNEELEEAAKPDFLDLDKDGDKEESMKKAAKDKEEK